MTDNGLVSERHAGGSNIEFHMTYSRLGVGAVFEADAQFFRSCDYAGFHFKCMEDGCENGGYDVAPVVAGLAKFHKK